jgi:hypothetical protein
MRRSTITAARGQTRRAGWGLVALVGLMAGSAEGQDCGPGEPRGYFADDLTLPTLGEAWAVGTADLNMDGAPDLLVGDRRSDVWSDVPRPDLVHVWLGDGAGGFEFGQSLDIGVGVLPYGFVSADLDGDGDPDVAVINQHGDSVTVLLGGPGGLLSVGQTVSTGDGPISIVAADVDGDGDTDLLVASFADDQVSLLHNQGDATFAPRVVVDTVRNLGRIAVADFDNDGDPDLAMQGRNEVLVSENTAGRFERRTVLPIDGFPRDVSAADVDGDGLIDLITGTDGVAWVYPGRGTLAFGEPSVYDAGGLGEAYASAASWQPTDVNGDGLTDLVSPEWDWDELVVLPGLVGGGFGQPVRSAISSGAGAIAIADFDLDGFADIAVANSQARHAPVLFGRGDATLGQRPVVAAPDGLAGVVATDLDGDGDLDLVAGQGYERGRGVIELLVMRNAGDGRTFDRELVPVEGDLGLAVAADLDADGDQDLVLAEGRESELVLLWNDGAGSFTRRPGPVLAGSGFALAAVDVDGDGDLDMVGADGDHLVVHRNFGAGLFEQVQSIEASDDITALAIGDFNNDGFVDAATCGANDDAVSVLLGRGVDGFDTVSQVTPLLPGGEHPVHLVAVDLTGDGVLDLATANYRSDNVAVLVGRGDGSSDVPRSIAVGREPRALHVTDINADGAQDLLVVCRDVASLGVLLNDGFGNLVRTRDIVLGSIGGSVHLADMDADGVEDLVASTRFSSDAGRISIIAGVGTCDRCDADVDGDGTLTVLDYVAFERQFNAGDPTADLDRDGELTIFDFLAFQAAFDAGCI